MTELNRLLQASDVLHQTMVHGDDEQTEIGLRDVILQIDHIRGISTLAKDFERGHLMRVLDAAREHLELVQTTLGDERREHLQEAMNQIVNLVRVYRVDRSYGIFFCPKDKTTWVQKGMRGENPFRGPASQKDCGIKVPN
jgi:hypothetical protein